MIAERASEEEIHKFYNENFYMVYGVFWDSFSTYEAACKKGESAFNWCERQCTKRNWQNY